MKKLLFILLALIAISCVETTPPPDKLGKLQYNTIELANKTIGVDSMTVVTEGLNDYVFIKKDGELYVYKQYTSDPGMTSMPSAALFLLLGALFLLGILAGSLLNNN